MKNFWRIVIDSLYFGLLSYSMITIWYWAFNAVDIWKCALWCALGLICTTWVIYSIHVYLETGHR